MPELERKVEKWKENNILSFEESMKKENTDKDELEKFEAIAKSGGIPMENSSRSMTSIQSEWDT